MEVLDGSDEPRDRTPQPGEHVPGRGQCRRCDARERHCEPAAGATPDHRRRSHRTSRVKGAVKTWPSTFVCRKSRQVPLTGTSTPTVSFPGAAERPVTLSPPRTAVQREAVAVDGHRRPRGRKRALRLCMAGYRDPAEELEIALRTAAWIGVHDEAVAARGRKLERRPDTAVS